MSVRNCHSSQPLHSRSPASPELSANCDDQLSRHHQPSTTGLLCFKITLTRASGHATIVLDPTPYGLAGDSPCGSSPSRTCSIETSLTANKKAVTSSMHGEIATIAFHQCDAVAWAAASEEQGALSPRTLINRQHARAARGSPAQHQRSTSATPRQSAVVERPPNQCKNRHLAYGHQRVCRCSLLALLPLSVCQSTIMRRAILPYPPVHHAIWLFLAQLRWKA